MLFSTQNSGLGNPLGEVLRLPCKFVGGRSDASPSSIEAIAEALSKSKKNVIPVIAKELSDDEYEAVWNTEILEAAREAKLDFVWCILIDDPMEAQLKIETGQIPKVSLKNASEKEIKALIERTKSTVKGLNKVKPDMAAKAIVDYYGENKDTKDNKIKKKIASLDFITDLKCGIGKAGLKILSQYLEV